MGQYLSIGLVTEISISVAKAQSKTITLKEVETQFLQQNGILLSNYTLSNKDEYWVWQLKWEIIEKELIPFLTQFYAAYYSKSSYYKSDCEKLLKKLSETPSNKWLEIAEKSNFRVFCKDDYAESGYISVEGKSLPWHFDVISLAAEGKILMEEYGNMFNFCSKAIQHQFSSFLLGKALWMYITG